MTTGGRRNKLIAFQRQGTTTNAYNEAVPDGPPATFRNTWAEVLFGSGVERREAAQQQAIQVATFVCMWTKTLDGVQMNDTILFDGASWNINSRALIGFRKEIHFTATRVA